MLKNCEIVKHCRYKCLQHRVSRLFHNFSLGTKTMNFRRKRRVRQEKKATKLFLRRLPRFFHRVRKKSVFRFRFFQFLP